MTESFNIWQLLAGLGIFLYGMFLLEDAIKALSGKAFRRIIRLYTRDRVRAIGSGAFVTALLQSSSAVSLMVLAFVGAGVMSMENGIGVMMGSNIGTTFTGWIVATLGFKLKIESFSLPFIGIGGISIVFFANHSKFFNIGRLLIGFGFLFLGLDYMKVSVEVLANSFDISAVPDYGLWVFVLVGILMTALMQSSSASIAIILTALNSSLITFDIGVAMIIGANVGTTVTVLLGAIGGIQTKKRVAGSHLIFNIFTAVIAYFSISFLVSFVSLFFDITTNSVMALALFHTTFNIMGVILFFPFVGILTRLLVKFVPDHKSVLTLFIDKTPTSETGAATAALKKEVNHLLEECQLYCLRKMRIDAKLVFDHDLFFEKDRSRTIVIENLYENIKLLHAEIFAFYSMVQSMKIDVSDAQELDRVIYASRNIMNSIKNFKGIGKDLEEFDASDNPYLNIQYKLFRRRLVEMYHDLTRIKDFDNCETQYRKLLQALSHVEESDKRFINSIMVAVSESKIQNLEISSLLLVNRLFAQACRLQVFSMKDILLTLEQINDFDRALDMKEIMDEEKTRIVVE